LLEILKDEINVKEILFSEKINEDMNLDINLTTELINEGKYRELVRLIQGVRQEAKCNPNDVMDLSIIILDGTKDGF
jgi:hypothetical protein